jgi:hypothetical protein
VLTDAKPDAPATDIATADTGRTNTPGKDKDAG